VEASLVWFLLLIATAGFVHSLAAAHYNNRFLGRGESYIPKWWQRILLAALFAVMGLLAAKKLLNSM
jgi:hypothetical protein